MPQRIIKYRKTIIAVSFLLTLGFSLLLLKLEIEPDMSKYFPETMASMQQTEEIEEVFGNQDLVMIIFEADDILAETSLRRIKAVEKELARSKGVRRTTSVFGSNHIWGEDGVMYVEPTIDRIPRTERQRKELREQIKTNDLVYKLMVSDDFQASALILMLEEGADKDQVFADIKLSLESNPGEEKVHFGGLPYLEQAIDRDIKRDAMILIPIALILMLIFLFAVFREWRGAWLPFTVVVLSALLGISLIPILGWKFYLITLLVPILLIAVANDYGIHMVARYQELYAENKDLSMKEFAVGITRSLWKPILLTGLTTIAGISALWAHTMIPARQMALVASIGILMAVFFSLVLLPALLSMLKKPASKPQSRPSTGDPGKSILGRFAFFVVNKSRIILPVALILSIFFASGIFFMQVDSNEENFFPERHEVKQAARLINSKFGGSESISLMFRGDMLNPDILLRMEHYRSELEKHEAVDHTMSFSGVVREISKALNDPGDPLYDCIPPSREAVAQYMELYAMNGDPEELEQLVDFSYKHAHLMVRINNANTEVVNEILEQVDVFRSTDPSLAAVGGNGYVRAELANKVLSGTYTSLGFALVIIFILLSLIFRSPRAGLLGIVPLLVSMLVMFGLMGLAGIRLDVATALLSSIMIGVGVDYTIHFLWRYREERQAQQAPREAILTTIQTTGRGIVFNALSVIVGFVVLMISSFTPIRFFGVLVVVSIFSCLIGAMVILPALILNFRFAFLEGRQEKAGKTRKSRERTGIRTLRRAAMVFILLLLAFAASSAQDARSIIERSHEVVKVSSFEALSTLTITDSKGNQRIRKSSMASMSFPDGTEKRIIKFLSPAEVKGTGILIYDYSEKSDDMWIYLPALRKTRRIVSREKSKSFMGSEFSNADMTAPGLEDFTYRILDEDNMDGKECYVIESTPVSEDMEDQYGYAKSISWVEKNNYLVHRIRYYDYDGELFKTISHKEFKKLGQEGSHMVTHMQAENHEKGRSSEMVMDQVAVTSTKESYFTVAYLETQ